MWHSAAIVLPVLSLLAGFASLYINPDKEPKKKWILVLILLLTTIASSADSVSGEKEKVESSKVIQNQSDSIKTLLSKTDTILERLKASGNTVVATQVERSLSADSARGQVLSQVQGQGNDGKTTIAYYPKDVDGPAVIKALREGGFQVETRTSNPGNSARATNAIWVGDSVSVEQAKFVALTLVRAGVNIVAIRRGFDNNPGAKKYLIEVGTDAALDGKTPLTVEQISALTVLPS